MVSCFSIFKKRNTSSSVHDGEAAATEETLPAPSLKVKRLDYYYSEWSRGYKYRDMSSKVLAERLPSPNSNKTGDRWKEFSFVIVRTIPKEEDKLPTYKIVIKSEYILKACQDIIKSWPGMSWTNDPLELRIEVFIAFYDQFKAYYDNLNAKEILNEEEKHLFSSTKLLVSTIAFDFQSTLSRIDRLISHKEITFDLVYAILVPGTIFVTRCDVTHLPRLLKLVSWTIGRVYDLHFESVDLIDEDDTQTVASGKVLTNMLIMPFGGTIQIDELRVYPLKFHKDEKKIRRVVLERGRKWKSMVGIHHKEYNGVAALPTTGSGSVIRHHVNGRIMVDRITFRKQNPNHEVNTPAKDNTVDAELSDEELLLTPTTVFGFSLADKLWLQFNVEKIQDVDWNDDAFSNLVLPEERKNLLRSLVEAHTQGLRFDDFVKGKGHGLVVNLFGPPGVGKTLSAEATSEHVRRPLYIIGAGDLGTTAASLNASLESVFEVATAWKAIILMDEADVFLEQRSLQDLSRNAMVAVFLRHVEYYRGILFLTTNRVRMFDEAFLSRIHVSLHFTELTPDSKFKVWKAFLAKVASNQVSEEQVTALAKKDVNGRQIKNAVRTAHSLAVARKEDLTYEHLVQTLNAVEEFNREFSGKSEAVMYA